MDSDSVVMTCNTVSSSSQVEMDVLDIQLHIHGAVS